MASLNLDASKPATSRALVLLVLSYVLPSSPSLGQNISWRHLAGARPADVFEGGHRDGPGQDALLSFPNDICIDEGGSLFVAGDGRIRRVAPNGTVSTYAGTGEYQVRDGPRLEAAFGGSPQAIACAGGEVYVLDSLYVRKVDRNGIVTTLFEDRHRPVDLVVRPDGSIYVLALGGRLTRVGSDGTVTQLPSVPAEDSVLALEVDDNYIYASEWERIFRFSQGQWTVFAPHEDQRNDDWPAISDMPNGLAIGKSGILWIADELLGILRVDTDGRTTRVPGLESASDVAVSPNGDLIVAVGMEHRIMVGSWTQVP